MLQISLHQVIHRQMSTDKHCMMFYIIQMRCLAQEFYSHITNPQSTSLNEYIHKIQNRISTTYRYNLVYGQSVLTALKHSAIRPYILMVLRKHGIQNILGKNNVRAKVATTTTRIERARGNKPTNRPTKQNNSQTCE